MPRPRQSAAVLCAALVTAALTGCSTEYHGADSGIDGVLWRQVAAFEDPLLPNVASGSPMQYVEALPGEHWDGTPATVDGWDLPHGGVVIYDVSTTGTTAEFSVFIASGTRPDVPTDAGGDYSGPSSVYTCYELHGDFAGSIGLRLERTLLDRCPTALVESLPADAAFASGEVFDG